MKQTLKAFTFCAIGTVILASQGSIAKAEETPVTGINLVLHNYILNDENATKDIIEYLDELNQYKGIAFASVSDYVNIRSIPGEDGSILGKLYNNSAATILEKSGDWYKVKSGSVTGYINSAFLITGNQAEELADDIGNLVAYVTTDTLKVRKDPNKEAQVLTLVANGDEFLVKESKNGWVKIVFEGNKTGYVSADYVDVKYEFEEAISIEEEQERIAAEQEAEQAEQTRVAMQQASEQAEQNRVSMEQAAVRADQRSRTTQAARAQSQSSDNNTSTNNNTSAAKDNNSKADSSSSSIRNEIVDYALRFVGNPYVWGGTSLTNGADCSGFTQSVFRDNGISIPRTSRTQALSGRRISIDEMQPGDLIFYAKNGTINHVGIYIGNGKIVAASSPETGIKISSYNYRQPYRVVSYIND
jgi:cell wall-associated NlpC family hydrolase